MNNVCGINFNVIQLWIGETENQRVFDVPAYGGFLIIDYRSYLEELFDVGGKIAVYKN